MSATNIKSNICGCLHCFCSQSDQSGLDVDACIEKCIGWEWRHHGSIQQTKTREPEERRAKKGKDRLWLREKSRMARHSAQKIAKRHKSPIELAARQDASERAPPSPQGTTGAGATAASTGHSSNGDSERVDAAMSNNWLIWQMVDSLYPTGGFAHSLGLEAAVQERVVKSDDQGASLRQFLTSTVNQAANFALPIVFSSIQAVVADAGKSKTEQDPLVEEFLQLNARATALYSNHVAKKASLAQGAAVLRLAISTYHRATDDAFQVLVSIRKVSKKHKHVGVHHAVIFGVVCGLLRIDVRTCQRMYLFFTLRDALSAATRLNLIGPMEATRIQYDMAPLLEQVTTEKSSRPIHDSYSSAPVLDLIQAMHDQLYTRIFNS